jgi:hypothetical protein
MTLGPCRHFVQRRTEAGAERGKTILDLQVRSTDDIAGDEAIPFQLSKLLGEHFVSDVGHSALQIVEAPRTPGSEQPEDQRFPFAAHDVDRELDRTRVSLLSPRRHVSPPVAGKRTGWCVDAPSVAIVNDV